MLFDGKTGKVLKALTTPDGRESYYSPVLYKKRGEDMVLFGTGGETHNGSLWVIRLVDLESGRMDKVIIKKMLKTHDKVCTVLYLSVQVVSYSLC